jgi:hypothetical protein
VAIFSYPENIQTPFELEVAKGNVPGHSVVNIFGYNASVGTAFIALWENNSAYTFPSTALTMTVNSNAADDGNVIRIIGLDSNYDVITENVTLDNGTPPTTTNQFFRINKVVPVSGDSANDITIVNGGTTYAKVRGGEGTNQASIYTVPRNHSLYLHRLNFFSGSSSAGDDVAFRNFVSDGSQVRVGQTSFYDVGNIQRIYPFKYNEQSDIQLQGRALSGTHRISVFGEGVLIQDGY